MTKRIVLYVRESLDGQSLADQILALTEIAKHRNWLVVKTYVDQSIAYEKNPKSGAAFLELCASLKVNSFDMVMVWSSDRIGRSLQEFIGFLMDIHKNNIDLYLHKQEIDTTHADGKVLFSMCSLFVAYERAIIRERVCAGQKRARDQGKKMGRPRVAYEIEQQIIDYREQGLGMKKIAKTLKIGVSVVQRVVHLLEMECS